MTFYDQQKYTLKIKASKTCIIVNNHIHKATYQYFSRQNDTQTFRLA